MKIRYGVLAMLASLSIITYLDRVCIAVAAARIMRELHLTAPMWGWALGAFTLGYSLFEIPSGMLGDRIGPRRVLTRIVVWWSAFTTATAIVRSYSFLLTTRFLFGVGEAGAYPNISSAISRWFPVAERGRAQGIIWMSSRIGGALAPPLVVMIQGAWGWRASFYCFGLLGMPWAFTWYSLFRDWPSQMPGISRKESDELALVEGNLRPPPLQWRYALRERNLWFIMAMYHTYCWGSHFYLTWLPIYLLKGRGFSEQQMGIFASAPLLTGAAATMLGGILTDFLSRRYGLKIGRVAVGSTALSVAALMTLSAALTSSKYAAVVFLTLGYGAMDTMVPTAWAVCMDIAGQNAATVTACMNTSGQLGAFLSSFAFGYLIGYSQSYNRPLFVMSAMLVLSSFLFSRIDPARKVARV